MWVKAGAGVKIRVKIRVVARVWPRTIPELGPKVLVWAWALR